jgi:hypothetical protein
MDMSARRKAAIAAADAPNRAERVFVAEDSSLAVYRQSGWWGGAKIADSDGDEVSLGTVLYALGCDDYLIHRVQSAILSHSEADRAVTPEAP